MRNMMMRFKVAGCFSCRECGYTFVEMLMVVLIVGILSALSAPLVGNSVEGYLQGRDLNAATGQARLALARLTRELRGGTSISSGGAVPFTNSSQIQFTPQGGGASVVYSVNAGQLLRTQSGVAVALADQVAGVTFTSNSDAPPVKLIDITLTLNRQHVGGAIVVFTNSVNPRNP
ncbi:MAG: prepilin-type N-terminal cleavage/methylation domain-containing protein [Magnetococcales bacterium]|nr:prepilin-type N-terminal cleavage/methylation domain-containing protein [Magnetococcales bacterium]